MNEGMNSLAGLAVSKEPTRPLDSFNHGCQRFGPRAVCFPSYCFSASMAQRNPIVRS